VVIVKDKNKVPDELDLESKKSNVDEELEQNNVQLEQNAEQEVVVPEQTDDAEDNRGGNNDVTEEAAQETTTKPTIGVVVIACNRPSVGRALDLLLK